jgi:hypothetical protein
LSIAPVVEYPGVIYEFTLSMFEHPGRLRRIEDIHGEPARLDSDLIAA